MVANFDEVRLQIGVFEAWKFGRLEKSQWKRSFTTNARWLGTGWRHEDRRRAMPQSRTIKE
jgi:hypothetical protein